MGTHPIFESDFDCLTEMGDAEPVVDPPPVQREEETKLNFLTVGYLGFRDFMAANGWYCLFGLILIAFIIKNLESRYQKIVDWWEVAKAKKIPTNSSILNLPDSLDSKNSRLNTTRYHINV